jgi:hypothetical protein
MKKRTQGLMNYTIVVLTAVSCIISISNNGIYQDGEWANAQWLGQDIVSLFIALPLLIISHKKGAQTNNRKWSLLNTGILLYFSYTYSFYMFASKLTFLYLFQLPIFGLSIFGFVLSCIELYNQRLLISLHQKKLQNTIIIYLSLIALMLSFIWLNDIFAHLTDPEHQSDTTNGEAPLIIYSLDLALIIPLMFISAILQYKQTNWGYILSGIILTKTSTLGFALMAMATSMFFKNLNPDLFLIILWCIIGLIGAILTQLYLKNLTIIEHKEPNNQA